MITAWEGREERRGEVATMECTMHVLYYFDSSLITPMFLEVLNDFTPNLRPYQYIQCTLEYCICIPYHTW